MKNIIPILFLLIGTNLFSQERKIVGLLNHKLSKEIKEAGNDDSLKFIQPFHIDENKKLTLEIEKYNIYMKRWEVIKTQVPLIKIKAFIKDINVIFRTGDNDVEVIIKTFNDHREIIRTDVNKTNMFFTEISREKNNEYFRDKILKAFKKAGYSIDSEFWYD